MAWGGNGPAPPARSQAQPRRRRCPDCDHHADRCDMGHFARAADDRGAGRTGREVEVVSDNADYATVMRAGDAVEVIGRVVWIGRSLAGL
jgi:hypothetical protein